MTTRVAVVIGEAKPGITEGRTAQAIDGLLRGEYSEIYFVGTQSEVNRELMVLREINTALGSQGGPIIPMSKVSLAGISVDTFDNAFDVQRLLVQNGIEAGSEVVINTSVWHERRAGYTFRKSIGDLYHIETRGVDDRDQVGWARRHILEPFQYFLTFLAGEGTTRLRDWWNRATAYIKGKAYKSGVE